MTTLTRAQRMLPSAPMGAENPLPIFRRHSDDMQMKVDASLSEVDRRYLGWKCAYRVLPYRLQDEYGVERTTTALPVCVLENEHLRAEIVPGLGGRLWSLYDKDEKRELLAVNPVFQPANLALRNAWFSGGVEFNVGQFGHTFLTCSPLFATRIVGSQGEPALRVYEWDRVKCFPFQIDFHLPPGSRFLFTHTRIVNPHEDELPMYWWTNIAVPERQGTRIICPTETIFEGWDPLAARRGAPWANGGEDPTYPQRMPDAREFFFCIPTEQRPWEAAVEAGGEGLVHASSRQLKGRKLFTWGTATASKHWQDILSTPGHEYCEIQAGLARTQMEHVPMPAGAVWEWTEAFGGIAIEPAQAHAKEWTVATSSIERVLTDRLPQRRLDDLNAEFVRTADTSGVELLARGSGWGALERRRLSCCGLPDRIPAVLDFGEVGDEQKPWLALLEHGFLPVTDAPGALMNQPEWALQLEASLSRPGGDHWLAWWHMGNMRMEARDHVGATRAWERSCQYRPTSWALRNLAIVTARTGATPELSFKPLTEPASKEAAALFLRAWEVGPQILPLAIEVANMLVKTEQIAELAQFVQRLPEVIRGHERIAICVAQGALHEGRLADVPAIFQRRFFSIREGELTITDLWYEYHERMLAASGPVTHAIRARARNECPIPSHLAFRMPLELSEAKAH